jgi:protein-S-isoprenylcysteine O-methyltransferase Ste14
MIAQVGTTIVAVALVLAGLAFMWFEVEDDVLFNMTILGQDIPVRVPLFLVVIGTALVLVTLLLRWLLWLTRAAKLTPRRPSDPPIDPPSPDVGSAPLL